MQVLNKSRWIIPCVLFLSGCLGQKNFSISPLEDEPKLNEVKKANIPQKVTGFGISFGTGPQQVFEVNIEAGKSHSVNPGQSAQTFAIASSESVSCRVTRVLKNASQETGQSLAWLKADQNHAERIPSGEF